MKKIYVLFATRYEVLGGEDKIRYSLAKKTFEKLSSTGLPSIIVDSSPDEALIKKIMPANSILLRQEGKGLGAARKQAMHKALGAGAEILILMEPEKESLVDYIERIVKPLREGKAQIVIPERNSYDSLPLAQQYSERLAALLWKNLTGEGFDMFFGPRAWTSQLSKYFFEYENAESQWADLFVPVMRALEDGVKVKGVGVDYIHPKMQTELENDNVEYVLKRIRQLKELAEILSREKGHSS